MLHRQRSVLDDNNPLARWHTGEGFNLPPSLLPVHDARWTTCSDGRARKVCCHRASEYIIQYTQTRHSTAAMALIPGDTGRR